MYKNNIGMTLVELVISVTILAIIMISVGISINFISDNLQKGNIDNIIYDDLNIFVSDSYLFRYNSGIILTGSTKFSSLLLYDDKEGILLGVFDENNANFDFKLASNNTIYSKKYFGYFYLKQNILTGVLNKTLDIYNLEYNNGKIFNNMIIKDYNILQYNSGALFDINLDIFRGNIFKFNGQYKNTFIPKDDFVKLNLNF